MKYAICVLAAVLLVQMPASSQSATPASADAMNRQKQELMKQQDLLWDRLTQIRDAHAKEADLADLRAVLDKAPKSTPKPSAAPTVAELQRNIDDAQGDYRRALGAAVAASPEIPAVNQQIAALESQIDDQNLEIRIAKYALGELRPKVSRLPEIQKLRADAQAAEKAVSDHPLTAAARKSMDDARKEYDAKRREISAAAAVVAAPSPSPSAAPAPMVDRAALTAAEKALDDLQKSDALAPARKARDLAQKAYDDALAAKAAAHPRAAEPLKKIAQAEADIKARDASLKEKRDKLPGLRKDAEAKDPRIAEVRKAADDAQKASRKLADDLVAANEGVIALNKQIDAAQEAIEDAAAQGRIGRFILDEVRKKLQRRADIVKLSSDAAAADKAFNEHPAMVAARKAIDLARKEWDAKGRPQAGREALTKAEKALDAVQQSDDLAAVRKAKEQAWKLYDDTLAAQVAASDRGRDQAKLVEQADAEGVKLQAGIKVQRDKLYALRQDVEAKDPRIAAARKAADDANKNGKATVEAHIAADPAVAALSKEIVTDEEAIEDLNTDIRIARFVLGELRPKIERLGEMQKLRADIDAADKALAEHPAVTAARKAIDEARKDYEVRRKAAGPAPTPKPSPVVAAAPAPVADRSALAAAEKAYDEVQKCDALAAARKVRDEAWKLHEDTLTARAAAMPKAAQQARSIAEAEAAIAAIQTAIKEKREKMPSIIADIEAANPEVAKARSLVQDAQKVLADAQRAAAKVAVPVTPEDKSAIRKAQQQFDKLLEAKMVADLKAVDLRKQLDELDVKIRQIDKDLSKVKHAAPPPK